jgi:ATP adenylyltransferase
VTDAFERLWAPHRLAYIRGENKPVDGSAGGGCPFCLRSHGDGEGTDDLVVARAETAYAVLNLYPYNAGHLLICPYRHVADYTDLTVDELADINNLTRASMATLRSVANAQGFNLGLNQGPVAGAGIAAHLHQHVVPRWGGDANFMPVIGQTKVLSQMLADTRTMLVEGWVG